MRLRLEVSGEELEAFARELFPATIVLSKKPRRVVHVSEPTDVALVPGRGLRVSGLARLQIDALGMSFNVDVRALTIMLEPIVRGGTLMLRPALERLDVERVPAIVNEIIVATANDLVASRRDKLSFRFAEKLSIAHLLPPTVAPSSTIVLASTGGGVEVTRDVVAVTISLAAGVRRGVTRQEANETALPAPPSQAPSTRPPGEARSARA